jgi:hypothetical protein
MQFVTGLVHDVRTPVVNVTFSLPSSLFLAVTARRMIVEAVKERPVLIVYIKDLVHAATLLGLLVHRLLALLRCRELSRSSRLRPLAR